MAEVAAEARDWISRLADHPGQYERPISHQEIIDHVTQETIRITNVALRARIEWDDERRRMAYPSR